jgi:predicted O-methyltransferase YrrM
VRLSSTQREVLSVLKDSDTEKTAQALNARHKTMEILRRNGLIVVVNVVTNARVCSGIYYRITDKGKREAS